MKYKKSAFIAVVKPLKKMDIFGVNSDINVMVAAVNLQPVNY